MDPEMLIDDSHKYTTVSADRDLGPGNAHKKYSISSRPEFGQGGVAQKFAQLHFQNGPIKEAGVNGIMDENLLAIVIDRLRGFQSGDFKCRENAIALTKLEESLMWLKERTRGREVRGVEGTHTV